MTVTGSHVSGTPLTIRPRDAQLCVVHRCFIAPPPPSQESAPASPAHVELDDRDLLTRAMRAKNGAKFARLWHGDTSAYASPSEADLALCAILAFWTGGNRDRIDRLFRQSALMRQKWDDRRGEQTIGSMTIARALR
jgi:putative DNA primase/helicase